MPTINRLIPRYLRKAFASKSTEKIKRWLARAYSEGFTKDEIAVAFKEFRTKFSGT